MAASLAALLSLAALASGSGIVAARAGRREAAAHDAWPPEGEVLTVGGRRVHVVVQGTGPDLVLIHGASGNTRDFTFAFAARMAARYRVIVMDRPGLGYTDRADPAHDSAFAGTAESPAEQAALLAQAGAEVGATRPIVLGHSYGGAVALAWALDHPAAAAVLVAGVAMPWPGGLGALYRINGSRLGGAILPPVMTAFAGEAQVAATLAAIFAPDPVPAGYAEHVGPGLTLRRAALRANARQVNSLRPHVVAMAARYSGLTLPVEVVHGTADTIVPPDIHATPFSAIAPNAALTLLPGVGHMPHHAAPDAVAAAIDRAATRAGLHPPPAIPIV